MTNNKNLEDILLENVSPNRNERIEEWLREKMKEQWRSPLNFSITVTSGDHPDREILNLLLIDLEKISDFIKKIGK